MKNFSILLPLALIVLSSCGGGSGTYHPEYYGGLWRFDGERVSNTCNDLLLAEELVTDFRITQNTDDIVVESDQLTLSGNVITPTDGFLVTGSQTSSDGCKYTHTYSFEDASDGEAIVGVGIVGKCGAASCVARIGGTATQIE